MTAMPPVSPWSPLPLPRLAPDVSGWRAELQMQLARRGDASRLVATRHVGPLRLQRPFYPEGERHPHVYLLHPPGGMVPGDSLDIDIAVGEQASGLVTTPASGKVYDVGERALPQRQRVTIEVADGGVVEWLPQDTLFFNGARYVGETTVNLRGSAQAILWDIATLGRRAGGFPFEAGAVSQKLSIYRNGQPLLLENMTLHAESPLLNAPWGLGGARTWGTLVATGTLDKALLEPLRELAADRSEARCSVTALKSVVIARYLGQCPLQAMRFFQDVWQLLRPNLIGREACAPRVWAT